MATIKIKKKVIGGAKKKVARKKVARKKAVRKKIPRKKVSSSVIRVAI